MIPPVIGAIYFGSPYYEFFIGLGAGILLFEVFFATEKHLGWLTGGAIYIGIAAYALIMLRQDPEFGLATVIWLFCLVWAADTGAYLVGQTFRGPKFAPRLSPKKTWSGFAGAVGSAGLVGVITGYGLGLAALWPIALLSGLLGAVSQCGDLLESWVKRRFDRKDMSALIPGHGGLADRADGLVAAAIGASVVDELTVEPLLAWL